MQSKCSWRSQFVAAGFLPALMALGCALASSAKSGFAPEWTSGRMPVISSALIPVGTIVAVRLEKTLSVEHAQAGQEIAARIAQDVPLPNNETIPVRSRVLGAIVSVVKVEGAADVSFRFDKIEIRKETIPVATSLRAMASNEVVRSAQMPFTGADTGTPSGWADTEQIGGDIRYGDGGKVRDRHKQVVGKGVRGGVLVHVRAQAGTECEGPVGDDRLQALWLFSADVCGMYGLKGVQIVHTGKTEPIGVITLRFEKPDMKLEGNTALLLRVVAAR
jgi:hypothetical protein